MKLQLKTEVQQLQLLYPCKIKPQLIMNLFNIIQRLSYLYFIEKIFK